MDCNQDVGVRKLRLQSLDIGSCLPEGDSFCTQRVPNSFCSIKKNECFCKFGYYSVQEDEGITCKTLLTNHKCQLDRDCSYVRNSICHPGAGACICPSGTIYVPQEHACRVYIKQYSSGFCGKCRNYHGICYQIEEDWRILDSSTLLSNRYNRRLPYGCKCPHNTITVDMNSLWENISSVNPFQRSDSNQVIQVSSDSDLSVHSEMQLTMPSVEVCWSTSKCIVIKSIWCCVCQDGYLPVYQSYLHYHDCVPICNQCPPVNKFLYQEDCACQETVWQNDFNTFPKTNDNIKSNLFYFSYAEENFTICYNASLKHQIKSSFFVNNNMIQTAVFMSNHLNSAYPHENCLLNEYNEEGAGCKTYNLLKHDILSYCASVQYHQSPRQFVLKTFIIVLTQMAVDFLSQYKVQYSISLTSTWSKENTSINSAEIKIMDSLHRDQKNSEIYYDLGENLKFGIQDPVDDQKLLQTVLYTGKPTHLFINFYHHNKSYKYLGIDQCSMSELLPDTRPHETIIVQRNCLLHPPGYRRQIKFNSNQRLTYGNFKMSPNYYLSVSSIERLSKYSSTVNSFDSTSNVMKTKGKDSSEYYANVIEFQINCIFRVCQQNRWCTWPSFCSDFTRRMSNEPLHLHILSTLKFPGTIQLLLRHFPKLNLQIPTASQTQCVSDSLPT
ncbi:unnamed protein product [Heterobilharzia americana]|nr:unnamed protein product [Heterobilharzia americana]